VSGSSPETPTTPVGAWGRSSAGRASPLQGEGQEFESPRLHHISVAAKPAPIGRSPDPCPRHARPPTSGPVGRNNPDPRLQRGRTLPTGIVIGKEKIDLRFRRVVRRIPILNDLPGSVTAGSGR